MKKNVWTKALTFISAAVMAAAVGLGAGISSHANAATATTPVVLTKYASEADDTKADTNVAPAGNQETVKNAGYTVYDITSQYWAYVDKGIIAAPDVTDEQARSEAISKTAAEIANGKLDGAVFTLDKVAAEEQLTGEDGQTTFTLDNSVVVDEKARPAVYEFVETSTPANYGTSSNFVISLPTKTNADGNAYVYPKDKVLGQYQIKFQKVDKNNQETGLSGAEFKIKNADGQYAQLFDDENAPVTTENGFVSTSKMVAWGEAKDATVFTSDDNGMFGFTANPETKKGSTFFGLNPAKTYDVEEVKAPQGYQNDADLLKSDAAFAGANLAGYPVTDTPEGILPHTGGAGIIAIVVAGLAITAIGVVAYTKRRANA
jgi:LPXTG-motif cell wall-anchored protein